MSAPAAERPLATLPKAHLHLHLEGAMRPTTLAELAALYGLAAPRPAAYGDFTAFNAAYAAATAVLRQESDLRRLVREVVEDARSDGAWYVEPALYAPSHRDRFGADEQAIELVLDELRTAGRELGVGVGLLVAGDRTRGAAECEQQARLAARYAHEGVVAFGLASDERGHPPEPFAAAFAIARDAGLLAAPHAGELAGPESVAGALDALGADRVQHGVRAVEDPALVARLVERGTCLDVCMTSNVALGLFGEAGDHPLPDLLAAGVRCSVNADDPLLFGPGLLEEYELCRVQLGLDDETLAAIARTSLEASGADVELVRSACAAIEAWLAAETDELVGDAV